jgi:hypothetical protein
VVCVNFLFPLPIVIGTLLPGEKGSKLKIINLISPSPPGEGFRERQLLKEDVKLKTVC